MNKAEKILLINEFNCMYHIFFNKKPNKKLQKNYIDLSKKIFINKKFKLSEEKLLKEIVKRKYDIFAIESFIKKIFEEKHLITQKIEAFSYLCECSNEFKIENHKISYITKLLILGFYDLIKGMIQYFLARYV